MHDFHGWTAGALWQNIKFDAKDFSDVERLAMVGETKWQHGMTVFCKPFTIGRVEMNQLALRMASAAVQQAQSLSKPVTGRLRNRARDSRR
jgi:hypothetical protein